MVSTTRKQHGEEVSSLELYAIVAAFRVISQRSGSKSIAWRDLLTELGSAPTPLQMDAALATGIITQISGRGGSSSFVLSDWR